MGVQIKTYDYSTLQTRYNERLTHRAGLLSIAHLMDSLSLAERIDQHFPQPKSNPGYRPSEFVETLILMQHEGSFHLDAFIWMIVATFRMMRRCVLTPQATQPISLSSVFGHFSQKNSMQRNEVLYSASVQGFHSVKFKRGHIKCIAYNLFASGSHPPPPPPPPPRARIALVLAFALALAGCSSSGSSSGGGGSDGGGGSGGGGGTPADTSSLGDNIIGVFADSETQAVVRAEAAGAAVNTPSPGSVTQSSSSTDADTQTLDTITVAVANTGGQLVYTVDRTSRAGETEGNLFNSSDESTMADHIERDPSDVFSGVNLSRSTDNGQQFAAIVTDWTHTGVEFTTGGACEMNSRLAAGDSCEHIQANGELHDLLVRDDNSVCIFPTGGAIDPQFCTASGGGNVNGAITAAQSADGSWVVGQVNNGGPNDTVTETRTMPDAEDTDYLAGGIWVYVPNDDTTSHAFGAFVDGSDPFDDSNLAAVAGTATYEGEATGIYTSADENIFFDAEASLTADFGDDTDLGTISGTIDGFESDDGPILESPTLTLETADIGNTDSGFFTGDTAVTVAGEDYAGKWGGQFYGNPEGGATGDDAQPGSVAGTFGSTFSDADDSTNTKSFIGIFGASKPTPSP